MSHYHHPTQNVFLCKNVHKFARFLKRRFYYAAPALAGPGRSAQSAQKEVGLARRRGGGASARFGGREGVGIPRQKPSAGRAPSRCIRPATASSARRMALAAYGWGYDVEVLRVGRYGQEWWCCRSVPHRREWRCRMGLLREQGVRVEADHLFAEPVVNMLHRFHDRRQLIDSKDLCCLLDVAE